MRRTSCSAGPGCPVSATPSAEGKTLDGRKTIDVYKGCGLKHLRYADNAVVAGITAVIDLVTTGRLRAFSTHAAAPVRVE